MGLIQLRFEDAVGTATIYSLWDDDETPEVVTALASMQDIFRAQTGAPFTHPGWIRALETCHAVQSEMVAAPLKDRFDTALRRFLERGATVPGGAAAMASLMVSYDAHYFRPYPDDPTHASEDHGWWGGGPHATVRISQVDKGFGPETILTIVPHPESASYFNREREEWDDESSRWNRNADILLGRRIKALSAFGSDLFTVSQDKDKSPVVTTRFDAATVATAYARVLGFPLSARVPLHDRIGPRPVWTPGDGDRASAPLDEGTLVVRFRRPAYPEFDMPEEVLTLKRSGGMRDLPTVMARLAALPMVPMHMEATDDRAAVPFHTAAEWCVQAEYPESRWYRNAERKPDIAVRVREAERYALGSGAPNRARVPQGYVSYLFTAEPGLWEVFPDGSERPTRCDIEVEIARVVPGNAVGRWVVHSSSDPAPTADSPDATNVTSTMTITPSPEHAVWLYGSAEFTEVCDLLDGWRSAFAPLRLRTLSISRDRCVLRNNFELLYLASVHARVAGLPVPAASPFGEIPRLPRYDHEAYVDGFSRPEEEALLTPAELERQRTYQAQRAAALSTVLEDDPFGLDLEDA